LRGVEDVVLAFDGFVVSGFVALDGEHFEHFLFLVGVAVVLDEGFEVLHIFETEQGVQDLFVNDVLPGL